MELLQNIGQLLLVLWQIVISLGALIVPWIPLLAWIGFWLFAVNWSKLYPILRSGGYIALILVALVMILVWGSIAPPDSGSHYLLGLTLSNFAGKTVYVTSLFCIMLLCGSVQLAGCCQSCMTFQEPEETPPTSHAHH